MVEKAREIPRGTGGGWTDQRNNADQSSAYRRMGDEIREQAGGRVDGFVESAGASPLFAASPRRSTCMTNLFNVLPTVQSGAFAARLGRWSVFCQKNGLLLSSKRARHEASAINAQ